MTQGDIRYSQGRVIDASAVVALYDACGWSSARKPEELVAALANSHALVTAWDGAKLVALGNALSDGSLVVFYPHVLVLPEYRRRGIGREVMQRLMARYQGFHQQMLLSDPGAVGFFEACGFELPKEVAGMWVYAGEDRPL